MIVLMLKARLCRVRAPDSAYMANNVTDPYCISIHAANDLVL
jgi:hypothetical protein